MEADGDLQVDIEEIQPCIDDLNEGFKGGGVERLRGICSLCGSLGVCVRPLSDDGLWPDEQMYSINSIFSGYALKC